MDPIKVELCKVQTWISLRREKERAGIMFKWKIFDRFLIRFRLRLEMGEGREKVGILEGTEASWKEKKGEDEAGTKSGREKERERERLGYLIKTGLYVVGRGLSYICNHQPGTIDIY